MRHARRAALPALTTIALSAGIAPASAYVDVSGGTQAPSASGAQAPAAMRAGGSEYGVAAQVIPAERPVVSELSVPSIATAGRPPRVVLRIDEKGVGTVQASVAVIDVSTQKPVITVGMGWVRTGRRLAVTWPLRATLKPGSYRVSVSAHDHHLGTLLRRAHSSGEVALTVKAKAPTRVPPASVGPPAPSPEAGVPSPAQSAAAGAVFPVAGAHNYGGPENRFGAPRTGHVHQGQDVLAAEATPVVAPIAGTILTTSYQAGGAGYYIVEHTAVGFDFMFAHCQAGSLAVSAGEVVSAGQALARVGQTGSATTPHVHVEMWVGGWQASEGHPIDPLPYLQAWDRTGAGG